MSYLLLYILYSSFLNFSQILLPSVKPVTLNTHVHVLKTWHVFRSCEPLGNSDVGTSQKLCLDEKSLLLLQASGKEGHCCLYDGDDLLDAMHYTSGLTGWNNSQIPCIGLYTQGIFLNLHPSASKPSAAERLTEPWSDRASSGFTSSLFLRVSCYSHMCLVFLAPVAAH